MIKMIKINDKKKMKISYMTINDKNKLYDNK